MNDKRHFRIYAEVKEQALFFKETLRNYDAQIDIIYTNAAMLHYSDESLISLIRNQKKFDLLVSEMKSGHEYPLVMVEFSTAVTTDDHEMQRADALFWSHVYKIPYLKIAPTDKKSQTAHESFGGGRVLSIQDQLIYMYKNNGVMYHIDWKSMDGAAYTQNNVDYPSCPDALDELNDVMHQLVEASNKTDSRTQYYEYLHNAQATTIVLGKKLSDWKKEEDTLLQKFGNSSRLEYDPEKKTMQIKVNRYGHAMDPERGMLAFWRFVLGDEWEITAEFQIERERLEGRTSYKSLFDGVPQEKLLMAEVKKIFNRGNNITVDEAIALHNIATSSTTLEMDDTDDEKVKFINRDSLQSYLTSGLQTSIYKNVMYYVDDILLSDRSRHPICRITWDKEIVDEYYDSLINTLGDKLVPLPLQPLKKRNLSEDIITWSAKELLEKAGYDILAISYPGAQGDRCVLIGEGKQVLRKYIDIIAISPTTKEVLIVEAKKELKSSVKDCKKLQSLVAENEEEVIKLLDILNINDYKYDKISTVVTGLSGYNDPVLEADYKLSFTFNDKKQVMEWTSDLNGLPDCNGEISVKGILTVSPRRS